MSACCFIGRGTVNFTDAVAQGGGQYYGYGDNYGMFFGGASLGGQDIRLPNARFVGNCEQFEIIPSVDFLEQADYTNQGIGECAQNVLKFVDLKITMNCTSMDNLVIAMQGNRSSFAGGAENEDYLMTSVQANTTLFIDKIVDLSAFVLVEWFDGLVTTALVNGVDYNVSEFGIKFINSFSPVASGSYVSVSYTALSGEIVDSYKQKNQVFGIIADIVNLTDNTSHLLKVFNARLKSLPSIQQINKDFLRYELEFRCIPVKIGNDTKRLTIKKATA